MSDQDVFENAPDPDKGQAGEGTPQQTPEPSSTDVFADKLSSIRNEDGTPKYTDVASALDSIPHAQTHISTLESEMAALKERLAQEQAAKELLAKKMGEQPAPSKGLTEEDVANIALKAQQDSLQRKAEQDNVASVNEAFSSLYGDKASAEMQNIAKESGMSISQIKDLAKSSPQAVYRLAGINPQRQTSTPPRAPGMGSGDQFSSPPAPKPPKSVMGGSNTKELVDNWRAAGEVIKQQAQ